MQRAAEASGRSETATQSSAPAASDVTAAVTEGACRLMRDMGFSPLTEFKLGNGRRADIAAINRRGMLAIVEVKASQADIQADGKWPDYLAFCDCFYFAVPENFPLAILDEAAHRPERTGVIVADRFGGAVRRPAPEMKMNAARRRTETLRFARKAAMRLHREVYGDADTAPMPLVLR